MHHSGRRGQGDEGAALVEFALVAVLLATLIFGIINFGLLLSFKQDMTRAAAEGARQGAVAYPEADALTDARAATATAVQGFDRTCGAGGLTCNVNMHDCDQPIPDPGWDTSPDPDCVTVELVYDYDHYPLLAKLPMIEPFLPDWVRAKSVARVNQ
ncbi:MAG TPA: TadE family protein [Acidimicrobiales bacterium]|jgi:hypothetical protein|nr:TadE family protein [Acidimicrobiales bacterium]